MTTWIALHPHGLEMIGFLPDIFLGGDPRPCKEQANERYSHGGGWHPSKGWKMDTKTGVARYPGGPAFKPVATVKINDETVWVYKYGFVAVVQPNGSFEISRMD